MSSSEYSGGRPCWDPECECGVSLRTGVSGRRSLTCLSAIAVGALRLGYRRHKHECVGRRPPPIGSNTYAVTSVQQEEGGDDECAEQHKAARACAAGEEAARWGALMAGP